MKSNQFNLTTRRYGVGEVVELMRGPVSTVYWIIVSDRFGGAGLRGLLVHALGSGANGGRFLSHELQGDWQRNRIRYLGRHPA